ncbi:hypothetical protein ACIHFD_57555 [Nonomuraea sp. NPDC051941]|uniref:hypothetical protein n=1 Tax=Nonomuraea sp. NPDC051941 TaxID=3364373 RepID=UPI0037CC6427
MIDFEGDGRHQDDLDLDDLIMVKLDAEPVEPARTQHSHPDRVDQADARADALRWSSRLTINRHDPLAVIRNAEPMLAFLAAATDEHDLYLRQRAGNLQSANDDEREPDDDGAAFALRAAVLYGAMTGAA